MDFLSSIFASSSEYFISFFQNLSVAGIFLALVFGAFWLIFFNPPFFKLYWLWIVLIAGALITIICMSFVQSPLQTAIGKLFYSNWTEEQLMKGILFTSIPTLLIAGLVSEGAKLIPVIAYWWRKEKKIDPKFAMVVGAVAGAGFGIMEAQSLHNSLFAMGWTWASVDTAGFSAILPFIERFFIVGFNIAMTAAAAYGLAKGFGWQYYLLVSFIHALMNYLTILFQIQLLSLVLVETLMGMIAVASFIISMWLLKRKEPKPLPAKAVK